MDGEKQEAVQKHRELADMKLMSLPQHWLQTHAHFIAYFNNRVYSFLLDICFLLNELLKEVDQVFLT